MLKQKSYLFRKSDYDTNGRNKFHPGFLFSDKVKECEADFIAAYSGNFPANYFFANPQTMRLLEKCFDLGPNDLFGIELINGAVDEETNLKIEAHSIYQITYAISALHDVEEPLHLIIDPGVRDNEIVLRHIPDGDGDGNPGGGGNGQEHKLNLTVFVQ